MEADSPINYGNSLDIVRPEDISSCESKNKIRRFSDSSGKYEHNYDSFLFIFSFLFALSCFLDIFLVLYLYNEGNNNNNNSENNSNKAKEYDLIFFLRIISDALCIFPWFIYMKHIDYQGRANKNIAIGVFVAIPQLVINILSVILILVKELENTNLIILISNIVNLVFYVLLSLIMLLRLVKTY